jgi:flagellar biosynthesis regulator FlbT
MKGTLKLSLKANEKIYINGAVVRPDRKVTIELMNDVQCSSQKMPARRCDSSISSCK